MTTGAGAFFYRTSKVRPLGNATTVVPVIVLFGSPVPENVGVESLVALPLLGEVMVGAVGAAVSTVRLTADDGPLVLPAESVAVAVTEYVPSAKLTVEVQVQLPAPSARA